MHVCDAVLLKKKKRKRKTEKKTFRVPVTLLGKSLKSIATTYGKIKAIKITRKVALNKFIY